MGGAIYSLHAEHASALSVCGGVLQASKKDCLLIWEGFSTILSGKNSYLALIRWVRIRVRIRVRFRSCPVYPLAHKILTTHWVIHRGQVDKQDTSGSERERECELECELDKWTQGS